MSEIELQLKGFRLTTAQIYYFFPDYPKLLQEFLWQDYDIAPRFPKLIQFIDFWKKDIEGSIHSVYVANKKLISHSDISFSEFETNI